MFHKINISNIASMMVVIASLVLLSSTSDSSTARVYGYGAGISVDNTSVLNGYATADNTFPNGFQFKMRVTVDDPSENLLGLKFADWSKYGGGGSIPASTNMLVNLSNSTVWAESASTAYGTPLTVGADLDTNAPGVQQDVYVWLKVPNATPGWSYSTSYGVRSSNNN